MHKYWKYLSVVCALPGLKHASNILYREPLPAKYRTAVLVRCLVINPLEQACVDIPDAATMLDTGSSTENICMNPSAQTTPAPVPVPAQVPPPPAPAPPPQLKEVGANLIDNPGLWLEQVAKELADTHITFLPDLLGAVAVLVVGWAGDFILR